MTIKLLQNIIFILFQIITWTISAIVNILLGIRAEKPKNLYVPAGTLVLANHQSPFDPWIIMSRIGPRNIFRNMPFRFPVKTQFMKMPLLGWFIFCCGGYDIGTAPLDRAKKLLFTRELIHDQYTVLLFPEGRIVKTESEQAEFKRGMEMLINENVPLLLVQLYGFDNLFSGKLKITFSKVYHHEPREEKLEAVKNFYGISTHDDSPH